MDVMECQRLLGRVNGKSLVAIEYYYCYVTNSDFPKQPLNSIATIDFS
jgi:hypothetical protein